MPPKTNKQIKQTNLLRAGIKPGKAKSRSTVLVKGKYIYYDTINKLNQPVLTWPRVAFFFFFFFFLFLFGTLKKCS